jgi:hypothetical protein
VFDVFPPRHLFLISFGMFEVLFKESDFDVSSAQESRDSFVRCLVDNACIAAHAAFHNNIVVYFITKRFPVSRFKLFDIDSSGSCILHLTIRNGYDHECLSTLKLLEHSIDNDAFVGLCWNSDDSK